MTAWYPGATIITGNNAGTFVTGYKKKGVLHTTESSTASSAVNSYRANNSWPHFTVGRTTSFTVHQHIPIDKAARSLQNLSGGVETNRGGAIQIEVVGFAKEAGAWPAGQIVALKKLMRWIETNAGVKSIGPGRAFASAYGQTKLRFTNAEWKLFNGWCGHAHAAENQHWDPGFIKIETLLASPPNIQIGTPMEVDEVQITPIQLNVPLDGSGKGWLRVPFQIDKIIGLKPHSGTRPGVDGAYDGTPDAVGITPDDNEDGVGSILVVQGGNPGGSAPVWFHIIEPNTLSSPPVTGNPPV